MATWGVEARIRYRAWNTSTNAGVAGDSANHTLTLRRAGTDSAFVGTVNDLGDGVYEAVVSGTLAETYELAMRGTSATADVVLFFESPVRTVKAAPTLTEIANQITTDHGAGSYVDSGAGLDAVGVRTAVGLASANLDSQLSGVAKPGDAMTLTTGERAAVRSDLLTETVYGQSLPLNFGVLAIGGDGVVQSSVEQVAGVAVTSVDDFKADVSGLLTSAAFAAALPDNFVVLSIDTSGNVTTTGGGGGGGLTPEQAAQLEAIGEKTALIGTDGALVEIVTPIGSGGEITLYSGIDYVDDAAGPLIIPVPAAVQSRVPAVDQPVYFQGRRRRTGTDYFDVDGIVIDDPDSPGSKAVSVPIPRGSIDSGFPFDDQWYYFVGDRPASLQDAFIAGSLKICPGPVLPG